MTMQTTRFMIGCMLALALGTSSVDASYVTITQQERYYEVRIDYHDALQAGQTPYEIGADYGQQLMARTLSLIFG